MISKLIFLGIEILIIIIVLKGGYIFPILQNIDFPFYDVAWTAMEKITNHTLTPPAGSAAMQADMVQDMITLLLYLCIYPAVENFTNIFLGVGRHEDISPANELFTRVCGILSSLFLSALLVFALRRIILDRIYTFMSNFTVLKILFTVALAVFLVILLYIVARVDIAFFLIWTLLRILASSALKFLGIEMTLMFIYYFLNVPGVFENVGTIVIMVIGIIMCLSAVLCTEYADDKLDKELERRKRRGYYNY